MKIRRSRPYTYRASHAHYTRRYASLRLEQIQCGPAVDMFVLGESSSSSHNDQCLLSPFAIVMSLLHARLEPISFFFFIGGCVHLCRAWAAIAQLQK